MRMVDVRWRPHALSAMLLSLFTLLAAGTPAPLHAQRQFATFPADSDFRAVVYGPLPGARAGAESGGATATAGPTEGRHALVLAGAGVLGGAVGLYVGAAAGSLIGVSSCDKLTEGDRCYGKAFTGLALGALLGEAALLPLGVHLADDRRGNYALTTLASLAITGAGVGLVAAADDRWAGRIIISSALLQLVTSVVIERRTAER